MVGEPGNLFTLFGFAGVVVGFLFISGQMAQTDAANQAANRSAKAAEAANAQTRRSVDRQIDVSRGRMVYLTSTISPDKRRAYYAFKNIGPSTIIIKSMAIDAHAIKLGDDWPDLSKGPSIMGFLTTPIESGGVYSTGGFENFRTDIVNPVDTIHEKVVKELTKDHDLLVIYTLAYKTIFGSKFILTQSIIYNLRNQTQRVLGQPFSDETEAHKNFGEDHGLTKYFY